MNDFSPARTGRKKLRAYKLEQKRLRNRRYALLTAPRFLTAKEDREIDRIQKKLRPRNYRGNDGLVEDIVIRAAKILRGLPESSRLNYDAARRIVQGSSPSLPSNGDE